VNGEIWATLDHTGLIISLRRRIKRHKTS